MRRILPLACSICFVTTIGLAQSRLNGKWATDLSADPGPLTDAQRKQSVQLDVTLDADKASGTLNIGGLGGTFYTFKDGRVTANKVQFRTDPRVEATWTFELVDDNTVMLYRGPLELVGNNVPDLIAALGRLNQPASAQAAALAQRDANASISGIVQDQSKALIPGATVTATNVGTGANITTFTDEAGRYGFSGMTPGKYTIVASVPGFRTERVSNLSFGDAQLLQDFVLERATAQALASPSVASCSRNSIVWCALLHRTK